MRKRSEAGEESFLLRLSPPPSHGEAGSTCLCGLGGGWFCLLDKAHLCAQRGRGCSSTMKRQRLQLPDPATSLPREPRSRAAFVTEEDTDPRHGGQGRRRGGETLETITTTIKKKKKKRWTPGSKSGGSRERPCDHIGVGEGPRVFPPIQPKAGAGFWGLSETCHRKAGQVEERGR